MNEFEATMILLLLFVLRCALPAGLMFALGYGMNWWMTRMRISEGQAPVVDPEYCPTFLACGSRCWSVRMCEEGVLPARCMSCSLYLRAVHSV